MKVGHRNKSILKVDEELSDWAGGALIAFGNDGASWPTGAAAGAWQDQVYDLGLVHLHHIVDHIRAEYNRTGREFELYTKGEEKVKGVRINCIGDETVCCGACGCGEITVHRRYRHQQRYGRQDWRPDRSPQDPPCFVLTLSKRCHAGQWRSRPRRPEHDYDGS